MAVGLSGSNGGIGKKFRKLSKEDIDKSLERCKNNEGVQNLRKIKNFLI